MGRAASGGPKWLEWAELPARKDVYTYAGTTRWGNHDLYPIPKKERTFGMLAYFAYWITTGVSVGTYTLGSSYIALGLNAGETLGAILAGCVISSFLGIFAGRPGMDYSLGYTMMNRVSFGLWGTTVPMTVVFLGGIVFSGIQAYYGGQAMTLILGAIFPTFHRMPNTLPASAAITTQNLIGFLLFTAIYLPTLWFVPPHQIRKGLYPSFIIICATFIGMLGWALRSNGGAGNLLSSSLHLTRTEKAFRLVQCMSSVGGTWGGAAERFSDWTRFERKRHTSTPGMVIALPVTVTLSALFGVLITTATSKMYGTVQWNPLLLLQAIQADTYTPASRAGTFFAGLGLLTSQIFVNLTQNTIPYGMDLAGLFPRYLSMKRASVMLVFLTIIAQPWRFLSQASIFVTILSVLSVYTSVTTSILIVDYFIIRKRMWKVPDLYVENGIYWYTNGWNLRCLAALVIGMVPALPGFFMTVINTNLNSPAVKIFQINYFVGASLGPLSYLLICWIWPVPGTGQKELMSEGEAVVVVEGVAVSGEEEGKGKEAVVKEKAGSEEEIGL
ncbi:hypothetical protein BP6252_07291 [Coleophoma cylindrospora]|uniref:Uncharacterized protein n=1 Tax=Coleophoma cylindrospora TaxID=1849047 RepID=A0A3D8RHL1_9HELO|nr:hypothetical protein BP6252_07291 [Coleophoma cylindrospora]